MINGFSILESEKIDVSHTELLWFKILQEKTGQNILSSQNLGVRASQRLGRRLFVRYGKTPKIKSEVPTVYFSFLFDLVWNS